MQTPSDAPASRQRLRRASRHGERPGRNPRLWTAVLLLPIATAAVALWLARSHRELLELRQEASVIRSRANLSDIRNQTSMAMDRLEAAAFVEMQEGGFRDVYDVALEDFRSAFRRLETAVGVDRSDDLAGDTGLVYEIRREIDRFRADHPVIESPAQVPEASWRFHTTVGWPTMDPPSGRWNTLARVLAEIEPAPFYVLDHVDTALARAIPESTLESLPPTTAGWIRNLVAAADLESESMAGRPLEETATLRLLTETVDAEALAPWSPDLAERYRHLLRESRGIGVIRATTPFVLGRVDDLEIPANELFEEMDDFAAELDAVDASGRQILDEIIRQDVSAAVARRNLAGLTFLLPLGLAAWLLVSVERRRRDWREALLEAAERDPLTRLPNRFALHRLTERTLDRPHPEETWATVLLMDLDNFKAINDAFGHVVGDGVLSEFSRRLHGLIREPEHAFRLGGDEFVVLTFSDRPDKERMNEVARALQHALEEPVEVEEHRIPLEASFGTTARRLPVALSDLLVEADLALHEVKEEGKGGTLDYSSTRRGPLIRRLPRALAARELRFAFQPQIDLRTGEVVGLEGLCRWMDEPSGGRPIRPVDIVDSVEWLGETDRFLRNLIHRFEEAQATLGDAFSGRFWLNVWPLQLVTVDLERSLAGILERSSLPVERMGIEITEKREIPDLEQARQTLATLRELGVAVALDDFGVYNASIERLTSLPLDVVKLDQRLVRGLADNAEHRLFVAALCSICHNRNLGVVAEGLENPRDLQILAELGVEQIQGWLTGQPQSADELRDFLGAWSPEEFLRRPAARRVPQTR